MMDTLNRPRLESPVLFIIFNRPESTKAVFERIREVKPHKLYIAADGPRDHVPEDKSTCEAARAVVSTIDWDCEVHKDFSDINLGCGIRPSGAIRWVLEHEESVIILEDDCLPVAPFFAYCQELLERYKHDNRIFVISGINFFEERRRNDNSYFFSKYGNTWGWASWRRVWKLYDYDMRQWPEFKAAGLMNDLFRTKEESERFTLMFDDAYAHHQDRWDTQFAFTIWSNNALCVIPSANLVTNVGVLGSHSNQPSKYHHRIADEHYRIKKHPDFVLENRWYDEYAFHKQWKGRRLLQRIEDKIKRLVSFGVPYFLKN